LADATTTGRELPGVIIVGACPNVAGAAAARPAAAPAATNSRRFSLRGIDISCLAKLILVRASLSIY
jgi:hypothetical protein